MEFSVCCQITLALATGSMIVMWLSEIITEEGIGNGSSVVITLNILSNLPSTIKTVFNSGNLTGSIDLGIGYTFPLSSYATGIGQPQYLCLETPQSLSL